MCHHPPLGGPEALETVVCVPVPMQMSSGHGTLFESVTQEALGEVVAGCPMQGSQVIIIAGPGYDALAAEGIQLNVTSAGGEELPCAVMEGVAAYTQTEPPESRQLSTVEAVEYAGTKQGSSRPSPLSFSGLGESPLSGCIQRPGWVGVPPCG